MKSEQDFLKQMENLNIPHIDPVQHQEKVKISIMNAERSAVLGAWLMALPVYFIVVILIAAIFHSKAAEGWTFGLMMRSLYSGGRLLNYLTFMLLPVICIIINLLAIVHVRIVRLGNTRRYHELSITFKLRLWNVLLILLASILLILFIV